jgi:hypothetical protein
MFRVRGRSFDVKSASFGGCAHYLPREDELEVWWNVDVRGTSAHVNDEVWHPNLHIEHVLFPIDDPLMLEHAEIPIGDEAAADGECTLFLNRQDVVWNLRVTFGERRGNVFDVLIAGDAWDPIGCCPCALRIMTTIEFGGIDVAAGSIQEARTAVQQFSSPEAFVVDQCEGGFRFKLAPDV